MPRTGVRTIPEGRLRLSKSPTAELGDAALQAQRDAGIEPPAGADFIIIAVPVGQAGDELAKRLQRAAEAGIAP